MGLIVSALAEDGTHLAGHCSSSEGWAKHDIGMNSEWKHEQYYKHYPDGFELVWLERDELDMNREFLKAIELNKAIEQQQPSNLCRE